MVIRSVMGALLLGSCAPPAAVLLQPEGAVAAGLQTAMVGSIERGGSFVAAQCSGCHAVGSDGASPLAAAPPLREISHRYPVEQLSEAFAEGFVSAHSTMPEFVLDAGQNRDLIAYLRSIQTR